MFPSYKLVALGLRYLIVICFRLSHKVYMTKAGCCCSGPVGNFIRFIFVTNEVINMYNKQTCYCGSCSVIYNRMHEWFLSSGSL